MAERDEFEAELANLYAEAQFAPDTAAFAARVEEKIAARARVRSAVLAAFGGLGVLIAAVQTLRYGSDLAVQIGRFASNAPLSLASGGGAAEGVVLLAVLSATYASFRLANL